MTAPEIPAVHRAGAELTALVLAMRHDWQDRHVTGALAAAAADGMSWQQAVTGLVRLAADPKAAPRDLVPDSRAPLARRPGVPPDRNTAHAAAARAGLARDKRTEEPAP